MASPNCFQTLQLQGNPVRFPFSVSRKPYSSFSGHTKLRLISSKFNLSELLGGRGLCSGELGLQQELKKNVEGSSRIGDEEPSPSPGVEAAETVAEDAFEKEMMGLTGGFPGGEKGLQKFINENPPPKKAATAATAEEFLALASSRKPNAPELPLLMPGMIAIVKNENSPYYMYCGIVQRITDGKAGVLFEGGNWDRLITFRIEELERREKGPPGKNPKSVILETLVKESE